LIAAAGDVLAERRIGGLSARLIARRAGVSNYTFYEHFESVDAVLGASFAVAAQLLVDVVAAACDGAPKAVSADRAVASALGLGLRQPGLAALMSLEVAAALPQVASERERLARRLADWGGDPVRDGDPAARIKARPLAVSGALSLVLEQLADVASIEPDRLSAEVGFLFG
jgi:AcrR family transcriptional regulator